MIELKLLGLTPFGCAMFLAATEPGGPAYLQYGALGLCAMVVLFLCIFIRDLITKLDRKDQVLADLQQKSIEAYARLADMLEDRPCLKNDKRIK